MFYVKSGGAILYTVEAKQEALRWAAAQARFRPALFEVFDNSGNFIKSFDGR
jgi:hypothetical protein